MRPGRSLLFVLLCTTLAASAETTLKVDRLTHVFVLRDVYLDGHGPYRMMIDTGAGACTVPPWIAKQIGLNSIASVGRQTAAGVERVPVGVLDVVQVGFVREKNVKVLVTNIDMKGVDGVLGANWLGDHDYLLDYHHNRLVLEPPEPAGGVRAPLRLIDGLPAISAQVNGRSQDLIVDSGAQTLVVFGNSRSVNRTMLFTNSGALEASTGESRVTIGEDFSRRMRTAEVNSSPRPGLLPAASFSSIYISNRDGVVVLTP